MNKLKRENQFLLMLVGKLTTEKERRGKNNLIGMTRALLDQKEPLKKATKPALANRLRINRSMLYYQHKRPVLDEKVKRQIEAGLAKHPAYGHKRIAPELKMNKKRILWAMKKFEIKP